MEVPQHTSHLLYKPTGRLDGSLPPLAFMNGISNSNPWPVVTALGRLQAMLLSAGTQPVSVPDCLTHSIFIRVQSAFRQWPSIRPVLENLFPHLLPNALLGYRAFTTDTVRRCVMCHRVIVDRGFPPRCIVTVCIYSIVLPNVPCESVVAPLRALLEQVIQPGI